MQIKRNTGIYRENNLFGLGLCNLNSNSGGRRRADKTGTNSPRLKAVQGTGGQEQAAG